MLYYLRLSRGLYGNTFPISSYDNEIDEKLYVNIQNHFP